MMTRARFLSLAGLAAAAAFTRTACAGNGDGNGDDGGWRVVHAFVALADNDAQGIAPVPPKIGDGDDPEHNLYWGCSDGLGAYFKASKQWKRIAAENDPAPGILRRHVFRHASAKIALVADAYRGSEIKRCTEAFLAAAAGAGESPAVGGIDGAGGLKAGAAADLVAYLGHNGLMDFKLPDPAHPAGQRDAIVLCCVSDSYFSARLRALGSRPVLMTRQLMYPGSFLLHDAIEGWRQGESAAAIRDRAANAYAKNQGISVKAARGVFADLE